MIVTPRSSSQSFAAQDFAAPPTTTTTTEEPPSGEPASPVVEEPPAMVEPPAMEPPATPPAKETTTTEKPGLNALASLADVAISALGKLSSDEDDDEDDEEEEEALSEKEPEPPAKEEAPKKKKKRKSQDKEEPQKKPKKDEPQPPDREKILALARGVNQDNDEPSTPTTKTGLTTPHRPQRRARPFPCVLRDMIENSPDEVVRWSDDGCVFVVSDTETLCLEVLPKYFRHCRLASFQRQLSLYQFRRARVSKTAASSSKSTPLAYYHALFERGCDEQQLRAITRAAPKHTPALVHCAPKIPPLRDFGPVVTPRTTVADGDRVPAVFGQRMYQQQQQQQQQPPAAFAMPAPDGYFPSGIRRADCPPKNADEDADDDGDDDDDDSERGLREAIYEARRQIDALRASHFEYPPSGDVANALFELRAGNVKQQCPA